MKWHLVGVNRRDRAACGVRNPVHATTDPASVTCVACQSSLAMAVSELEARLAKGARARKRRRSVD